MEKVDKRKHAAEMYLLAVRTGEGSATATAAKFLAPDVVLSTGKEEFKGAQAVTEQITGIWAQTPVFTRGAWSDAEDIGGGKLKISGNLRPLAAAPSALNLTFSFNAQDQISRVDQETIPPPPPVVTDKFPDFVRGAVNSALAQNTPMVVAVIDENGQPALSLRGSTQIYSDHQLCIWVRNSDGSLSHNLARNPRISLLYRDSYTRSTLIFQGIGHFETDPDVRDRVYSLSPEVERKHDVGRKGSALIIDVTKLQGNTWRGGVRFERKA